MSLASERHTVQNPLIRYAIEAGWTYLPPDEALRLRGGDDQPFLREVLIDRLQTLNPNVIDSVVKAEEVINRLLRVPYSIEGNYEVWEYLKGLKTTFVPSERRERNLHLLDIERPDQNHFHVTGEFVFRSQRATIRADAVLLINGIPVMIVETKAATRREGIAEAFSQLSRYHAEAPALLAQTQIFVLTNLVQFFYGATWSLSRKTLLNWREDIANAGETGSLTFVTLVKAFLDPRRTLRILADYILFVRKDGELSKVILRPHQMRAAEKIVTRAHEAVTSQPPAPRRGLIWHTQGSGKTYTMISVARMLLADPRFANPTVLLIVDRNELEQQLFQNLAAVGINHAHLAQSKHHLRHLLRTDTRGLIVSMIHKFDNADADLNRRANIFVLIDEAHRSTGGDLGNFLMGALPNATFIGFTGTPIDRSAHGKGTFKVFGDRDPGGYLDKYSIRDAIADGATVPLHYQMAPNHLIVDQQTMENEFWAAAELEGVADIEEINRVLDRAVTLKNMLKNRERIALIAQFVANHYCKYVEPMGYKAFLVAVDREACGLYKAALDQFLPPEASQVVISRGHNDPPELKRWHLSDEAEAAVRRAFRKPNEQPKLLIVTEKLLTGYDAPILYAMYLDKPMRDHVLLQAIARVNRPYEDEQRRKTNGLIIDFVGVFNHLEKALAFDSQEIEGVVAGLEVLRDRFAVLMDRGRDDYLRLFTGKTGDQMADAALNYFRGQDLREEFYAFFRELEEVYEILSPDPFLRPYLNDYQQLVDLYRLLRSAYEPHVPVETSFLRKTAAIVQQNTSTKAIHQSPAAYEIGAGTLLALAAQDKPDTVKVFNMLKELRELVAAKGGLQPHLIPIGERAESIRQAFEERQLTSEQALSELTSLAQRLQEAEAERRQSQLSPEAFAVAWWLQVQKGIEPARARQLAAIIEPAFRAAPHWTTSPHQERELRRHLYKALVNGGVKEVVAWANELLALLRRTSQASQ